MRLARLRKGKWEIYAACDDRGKCDLRGFLDNQPPNLESHAKGMRALLQRVADHGPRDLPDTLCRTIGNAGDGLREFKKGRLRIFWFYDEGQIVICSHGLVKQTQKTPAREIERASACRRNYFADKERGRNDYGNDD